MIWLLFFRSISRPQGFDKPLGSRSAALYLIERFFARFCPTDLPNPATRSTGFASGSGRLPPILRLPARPDLARPQPHHGSDNAGQPDNAW